MNNTLNESGIAMRVNSKIETFHSLSIKYVILFILTLVCSLSSAISQQYSFTHYSNNNGLPHSIVNCGLQDKTGLMWFGTGDGLVRYDGYNFTVYKAKIKDPTTLSSNIVSCIVEDREGLLWVGTSSGLNRFDPRNGESRRFLHEEGNPNSLSLNEISCLFIDDDGRIYIGQRGLQIFDPVRDVFTTIDSLNIFINPVTSIFKDSSDKLFIASNGDGLFTLNTESNRLYSFPYQAIQKEEQKMLLNSSQFYQIMQDKTDENLLWLASNIGIVQINKRDNLSKVYSYHRFNERFSEQSIVRCMFQGNDGQIWIGTEVNGLFLFNPKQGTFETNLRHEPNNSHSLNGNNISFITGDFTGNVWVGTFGSGINVTSIVPQKFKTYFSGSGTHSGVAKNTVWSLLEDRSGRIWVGTQEDGIKILEPERKELTADEFLPDFKSVIGSGVVSGIAEDKNGEVWAITWNGTLNRIHPETREVKVYLGGGAEENELIGWSFRSLFIDEKENIWLGSMGSGLEVFNKRTGRSTKFVLDQKAESIDVYALYQGKSGALWCGTSQGIYRINTETFERQLFPSNTANPEAIQCNDIFAFYEERDSLLWIATQGCGIYRMNTRTSKLINYTSADGLPSDNIYSIYADKADNLWMSTSNGLAKFNRKLGQFRVYKASDGLQSNEFKWGAHFQNQKGELLFGGTNGVNVFNPDSIVDNPYSPRTILTDFKISNKQIYPGEIINKRVILNEFIEYTRGFNLTYKESDLSFEFSALHFAAPEKNKFAYRLEGYNDEWIHTDGNNRVATYTNLPPGEYTFRVKSSNNDGLWCARNDEVALLISISPPFWKTWYFQLFLVLFILRSIYSWFRYRTRRIRMQRAALERTVTKRTAEIIKQRELLAHQNEELVVQADNLQEANILLKEHADKLKSITEELQKQGDELYLANRELTRLNATKDRFFSILAHDLRNPFHTILEQSALLLKKVDHKTENGTSKIASQLNAASKNAYALLESLLEWSQTQQGRMQCNPVEVNVKEVVHSVKQLFALQLERKEINVRVNLPAKFEVFADKAMVATIIRNIVGNAIKFTPIGGSIDIEGDVKGDFSMIVVADTGLGMSEERVSNLFQINKVQPQTGTEGERGSGLGLIICSEFAKTNKGRLEVSSIIGEGSTVQIFLPSSRLALLNMKQRVSSNETTASENARSNSPDEDLSNENYHILVVDDNPTIRKSMVEHLQNNFQLTEASNGKEALNEALNKIPDLIVSDVMMPEMDGMELCQKLKQDERTNHIPVILLTARFSDTSKIEGYRQGADDYLTKPFSAEILKARIYNLLKNREKLKEKYNKLIVQIDVPENEKERVDDVNQQFIKKLVDIISARITDAEFSVDDLAGEVGMSHSTLYRKLTGISSQNPSELIKTIRIKKAAYLLQNGTMQISEVMYAVGMKDASYFTKVFKKQLGQTPTEYKKMFSNDL